MSSDLTASVQVKGELLVALRRAARFVKWDPNASTGLTQIGGMLAVLTVSPDCELTQYVGAASGEGIRGIDPARVAKWLAAVPSKQDVELSGNSSGVEICVGAQTYTPAPICYRGRDNTWSTALRATYTLPRGATEVMLKQTLPIYFDGYRPALQDRIALSVSAAGFKMSSTDGYRMAIAEEGEQSADAIRTLPLRQHLDMLDGDSSWKVEVFEDSLRITCGDGTTLRCKSEDIALYPDVERVRPKEWVAAVNVSAQDFAVRTKPFLAIDKKINVKLEKSLHLSAVSEDGSRGETTFDASADDCYGRVEEIDCLVDGKYLTQMANLFKGDGTIEIRWTAPTKPVAFVLHNGSAVHVEHVIMPLSQIAKS